MIVIIHALPNYLITYTVINYWTQVSNLFVPVMGPGLFS